MAVATAMSLVLPLAATATAAPVSAPLATGLDSPLGLAVGSDGTVYVAQSFAGMLTAIDKNGTRTVAQEDEAGIAGVDARGAGTLVYTTSAGSEEGGVTAASLKRVLPNGRTRTLADVLAYETENNPDKVNSYGFLDLGAECKATLPPFIPGDPYDGEVDANPYSVLTVPGGWVIADAAGNDLLRVSPNGQVRTLAVLPAQPVVITADMAAEFELNDCVVGKTYNAEPVPTDVEMGPDGMLYVSLLAGGPAPGAVYRVDPRTGAAALLAGGFAGATGLAVAPDGTVYVAELFGGQISKIVGGGPQQVAEVPFPAALEWANGMLYATIDVFGDGKVVTITP
ncbi:MAG: ScyD/ScyE family protein [Actinomycetota bacterium]|nr:ScyD/ScyE family protein [Actinomycetota bacterium]